MMAGRIKYALRISILVFYCIYAVSPVYLTSAAGGNDRFAECGRQEMDVTCGIVWINVLLSTLVAADRPAPAMSPDMASAEHGRGFILVRKQRAVLRESIQVKPEQAQRAGGSSTDLLPPMPPPVVARTFRSSPFRYEDFCLFSHAGLSPPSHAA